MAFFIEDSAYMSTAVGGETVIVNPVYEAMGVFSRNAAYQLQGTLWGKRDGVRAPQNILGNASYVIRDKDRNTIGISQSGLTADSNGLFAITPVAATAITDLTHYTVEITITIDGVSRVGIAAIVVGER